MSNVLIIGSGGREHALAWKLKQSPRIGKLFVAPGNAGTAQIGENINFAATDIIALADWAEKTQIDFTVVGPDDSLALGVVDEFQKRGLKIWGPSKAAAQIEASKAFAKDLMKNNNIPTAQFETFTDYETALSYLEKYFTNVAQGPGLPQKQAEGLHYSANNPIVIKASGLALGKGVMVCKTLDEAEKFLEDVMINKIFGNAGDQVVIEEFLQGQEFSIHAFSDGNHFQLLPSSQDHKAAHDGNTGPNTGGMGTIAPVPWMDDLLMGQVSSAIVKPALDGLKKIGSPFVGLLYPGLMAITADKSANYAMDAGNQFMGSPKVIEFNSRFGDPETQSYMRLLKTDLLDIFEACVDGTLDKLKIEWSNKYACCIVLASGGYPGKYEKGKTITGIQKAEALDDIVVFHAGTILRDNNIVTNGGRVLGVTAVADDLQTALNKAYAAVKLINFDGKQYRTDIGRQSLFTKH
ncbi:MAG: phosphoribosylamine--glycine ligase [Candidatus Doudnabacteria bacterium]|nr:phosphoribosylamine--glycine ligase [Candidatus Doudnabacteria bacterium]